MAARAKRWSTGPSCCHTICPVGQHTLQLPHDRCAGRLAQPLPRPFPQRAVPTRSRRYRWKCGAGRGAELDEPAEPRAVLEHGFLRGSCPCFESSARSVRMAEVWNMPGYSAGARQRPAHPGRPVSECSPQLNHLPRKGKCMNMRNNQLQATSSRRQFLKQTGGVLAGAALLSSLSARSLASEDNTLKIALIGCGGRGTGAAANALDYPRPGQAGGHGGCVSRSARVKPRTG